MRQVINDVSFSLRRGETLGIVGESGSGKSVTSMSLMQLLPPNAVIIDGKALFAQDENAEPIDLLQASHAQMQDIRGRRIAMIFQEPMTSLNPVHRCGKQIDETLKRHTSLDATARKQRILSLFREVMLPDPERTYRSFPHEISGGQKQRVMIAMALACNPDILIADEPTTALDVTVQRGIIDLLLSLQRRRHMAIIFVTHDLGVVSLVAHRVMVMYKGQVVEEGTTERVLHHPTQPYTRGLLACRPPLDARPQHLPTVQDMLEGREIDTSLRATFVPPQGSIPLLSVNGLKVDYAVKRNLWGHISRKLTAVDDVSFDLYEGETLGLVGESGCGKTSIGRALMGLISMADGSVAYRGNNISQLSRHERRNLCTKMQIVFQDPYSSLNPRQTIGQAILEPLRVHRGGSEAALRAQVIDMMQQVGLEPEWYSRFPHEFSGGQRQRVCIARALVLKPEMVVCDESVSALDVSVQAQVLNLLNDLKQRHGFSCLFITHDLSVVRFLADRVMVMQRGKIEEMAEADSIFNQPQTSYTQSLLDAVPRIG